jgi:hypothetical protein
LAPLDIEKPRIAGLFICAKEKATPKDGLKEIYGGTT